MQTLALKKSKEYLNIPSTFSKIMLLQGNLLQESSLLIIVENDKIKNQYIKISEYLYSKKIIDKVVDKCDNIGHIIDIIDNRSGIKVLSLEGITKIIDMVDSPKNKIEICVGSEYSITELSKQFCDFGYQFQDYECPGSFQFQGDTLRYTNLSGETYFISFWGETIEKIEQKNHNKTLEKLYIGINKEFSKGDSKTTAPDILIKKLKEQNTCVVLDNIDYHRHYESFGVLQKSGISFPAFSGMIKKNEIELGIAELYLENLENLKEVLKSKTYKHKYIFTKNTSSFRNFLEYNKIEGVQIYECQLSQLKSYTNIKEETAIICDDNISRIFIKKRRKRSIAKDMDLLLQIQKGDYIVHIDHGIGIFEEIQEKKVGDIQKEYIKLLYKNNDILFVPITEVGRLSKYIGAEHPKLTPLSSKTWETKLKKVEHDTEAIAKELLEVYAKRKIEKGFAFHALKEQEEKFQKSFEHNYTDDQIQIIKEIFDDMEKKEAMERLLCGDVGFGKTEIAFNGIFKAIANGKQAALISPLVVLAYEHFQKAKERFHNFPFCIEVLTRFESASKAKTIIEKLKSGKIDLIIGTHRLLSEDISYKDLGFLVIDEEHKFGVADKEKIKKFKGSIDILSMSATPIPRSMNMALSGIKDVSTLRSAPLGRQAIQTSVIPFSDSIIYEAGKKEFERGGQMFFIHNRVETITHIKKYLEKLFPRKKVGLVHGQLSGDTIENTILDFKTKKYDILLSTTVIENGIDFPNVNTIFINNAGNFGISQIHQLRGRVGRSNIQGYCYLLFQKDKIKEDAVKRLKTIVDYSHLGAGFELAMKDLEIRGGGDILGIRQSGQSVEVGVNIFLQMLEHKIEELKNTSAQMKTETSNTPIKSIKETKVDLNIETFIDGKFFDSELDKLNFYREIESISEIEELDEVIRDFCFEKENIAKGSNNFFDLLRLKLLAKNFGIQSIKKVGINYQIDFHTCTQPLIHLKNFLKKDTEVYFRVITPSRIRSEVKKFTNEESFLQYMLELFQGKNKKRKIKLKK